VLGRPRVLVCALGLASFAALLVAGCSRTDPLDYPSLGPPDAGTREARADVALRDTGPRDVFMRDLGPPDRGPPDVTPDVPKGCSSDSQCDDGLACTVDHCDVDTGVCAHVPDDSLCPAGFACFPIKGCYPGGFAQDNTNLFGISLPAGTVTTVGLTGKQFTDIALSPEGVLYGVTDGALFTIDTTTGVSTEVALVDRALDGLDFGSDGTLYGAAGATTDVSMVNPVTGALTVFANLPVTYACSGDVAVLGTTLFVTANDGSIGVPDILVAIDLNTTPAAVSNVGSTGHSCIYGLAAYEGVLYGFTCLGDVLAIDTATASSTVVAKNPGHTFFGATAR
jgi:hypothetical protein